jgi:hypothetical protein
MYHPIQLLLSNVVYRLIPIFARLKIIYSELRKSVLWARQTLWLVEGLRCWHRKRHKSYVTRLGGTHMAHIFMWVSNWATPID